MTDEQVKTIDNALDMLLCVMRAANWEGDAAYRAGEKARALLAAGASEGQAEPVAEVTDGHFEVTDGSQFPYKVAVLNEVGDQLSHGTKLYTHPSAEIAALRERIAGMEKDAERLDWLDATNSPFKMGWHVGVAPAGNVAVRSIICLGARVISIREAIDTAKEKQG